LGEIVKGQLVKTKLQCNAQKNDAGIAILVEFSHHLKNGSIPQGIYVGGGFRKAL
jgi:hypothetical protein